MAGSYNLGSAEGLIRIRYDGTGADQAQQGFRQTQAAADRSSATFDRLGARAGIAGVTIAAGVAFATNKAMDFEKEISAIGAVSGATRQQLEAIRTKALQLGADTSFSASEAALAMEELVKAGVPIEAVMNGAADATVALAAAGGVALPDAATIAANAMNAFGLAAADLPKVADLIAGAANASAIDVGQFGQSLQQAGAVAHLAGVPFSDLAVAIAEMGNAGIKGSDAGTSLKTFLQNLIPTTKEQTTLMSNLGLITKDGANQFFDASGKVKSLADVAQLLQNALKGMGKEQQLATLQTLFGSDAIRGAAILADGGAQGFNNLAASMGKVSAQDVAAERLDNTAGKIEQLKGSVETAAISLGSLLLPRLTSMAKALAQAANWINGLSPGWQSFIVNTALAGAGILLFVAAAAKIITMVGIINGAVTAIKAWTIWTKVAAASTKIWAAAQAAFNAIMALNPIVLIIIAVIALIAVFVLLWTRSSAFRDFFIGIWNAIWGFLKSVGAWFAGPFANFFVNAWNIIKAAFLAWASIYVAIFNALKSVAMAVFNAIKSVVMGAVNFLVSAFQLWWSGVQTILNFFAPIFSAIFNLVVTIVRTAWAIITAIFQVAVTIWGAIFSALWSVISAVFQAIWSVIVAVATGIWNFLVSVGSFILAYWQGLWNGFMAVISAVWNFIGPYIMAAVNAVVSFLVSAWTAVSSTTSAVWNAISGFISSVWTTIRNAIIVAASTVINWLLNAWNSVRSTTSSVWNAISNVISSVWNAIVGIIRGAVQTVANVINGISVIVGRVGAFFGQLKGAAEGGVGSLLAFVGQIPGRVLSGLGNLASLLYDSGRKIIQGLVDGIKSMIGAVGDAVGSVMSKARNLLPFSPAKEGPFSGKGWTLYSGQSIVEALATGIIRSGTAVQRAIASVLADARSAVGLTVAASGVPATGSSLLALSGIGSGSQTTVGGASTVFNNTLNVNAPAPLVDADQVTRFGMRRLTDMLSTATGNLGGS